MSDRSGDGVEALLRATGRRPAPPAERTRRVREVVRVHWEKERRRRIRRRALWIGIAAAAAAGCVFAVLVAQREGRGGEIAGRIERAEPAGSFTPGDAVPVGERIATAATERLALRLASGDAVRLDQGTQVHLLSPRELELEGGAIYVDGPGTGGLAIRTPFGRLEDEGTQFVARVGEGMLRVGVREGRVSLDAGGRRTVIEAGWLMETDGHGPPVTRAGTFREMWAWAGEITPMMAIEGRSAGEFLRWIARERCLVLRFEDPDIAASADNTRLRGSIEGMTLEQALASVLPTCGMRHRIEGEVLHVGPVQ